MSPEIRKLLEKHGNGDPKHECEGSKFHSPRPLRVHSVLLYDNKIVYLCGTCRDNLFVYLHLWESEGGLDWPTQRLFGNQIRFLGELVLMSKKGNK